MQKAKCDRINALKREKEFAKIRHNERRLSHN